MSDTITENTRAQYGNPIIGVWWCPKNHYECFPRQLQEEKAEAPFKCPKCSAKLYYDEEE